MWVEDATPRVCGRPVVAVLGAIFSAYCRRRPWGAHPRQSGLVLQSHFPRLILSDLLAGLPLTLFTGGTDDKWRRYS